jgi:6-phosphofructokinase 1
LIGIRGNNVISSPLVENVQKTQQVVDLLREHKYADAMTLRGRGFVESYNILNTLLRAHPQPPEKGQKQLRLAVMHAGAPAPGMNTAARVAIRLGLDQGHVMLGIHNGVKGLLEDQIQEMNWMSVHGWVNRGGAELGTSRDKPAQGEYDRVSEQFSRYGIDGLLIIGGWSGYQIAYDLHSMQKDFPSLRKPIVCVPATINQDLPGTEVTIGADTALNSIVYDVDKIKDSAVASRRCYVVEVMGHDCGYLALMGGMATGAERVYLPEEGISLDDLRTDVARLVDGFEHGKRLGLIVRSEHADPYYTTDFLVRLFEKESQDLFDVRRCVLGHTQQGGRPSPYDRIQATRLTSRALTYLVEQSYSDLAPAVCIGRQDGQIRFTSLSYFPDLVEPLLQRPLEQKWLERRQVAKAVADYSPVTD